MSTMDEINQERRDKALMDLKVTEPVETVVVWEIVGGQLVEVRLTPEQYQEWLERFEEQTKILEEDYKLRHGL